MIKRGGYNKLKERQPMCGPRRDCLSHAGCVQPHLFGRALPERYAGRDGRRCGLARILSDGSGYSATP